MGYGLLKARAGVSDFERGAEFYARHPQYFTADVQLELYALFKQATVGDAVFDHAKRGIMWEAWKSKCGMSSEQASRRYVGILDQHCPKWRGGGLKCVGHGESEGWAISSVPMEVIGANLPLDESVGGQLCAFAAEGKLDALADVLDKNRDLVNVLDVDGMTPLHWAADRGHTEMVRFLLRRGADCNALDHCLNSPLHIAGMAGQKEVVRLLIDARADLTLVNAEGDSARSILKSEFPKLVLS